MADQKLCIDKGVEIKFPNILDNRYAFKILIFSIVPYSALFFLSMISKKACHKFPFNEKKVQAPLSLTTPL